MATDTTAERWIGWYRPQRKPTWVRRTEAPSYGEALSFLLKATDSGGLFARDNAVPGPSGAFGGYRIEGSKRGNRKKVAQTSNRGKVAQAMPWQGPYYYTARKVGGRVVR